MTAPNYSLPSQSPDTTDTSTVSWFNSIASSPPPEPPKHSPRKRVIIVAIGLILLMGAALAVLLFSYYKTPDCLNKEDYQALTGKTSADELSPRSNFYTYLVDYEADSAMYSEGSRSAITGTIEKLSIFYREREASSIILTLSSDYVITENADLAAQRIATLKASLVKAGIPEQSIGTVEPQMFELESDAIDTPTATISITSATSCR